jgi:hypothetical protein
MFHQVWNVWWSHVQEIQLFIKCNTTYWLFTISSFVFYTRKVEVMLLLGLNVGSRAADERSSILSFKTLQVSWTSQFYPKSKVLGLLVLSHIKCSTSIFLSNVKLNPLYTWYNIIIINLSICLVGDKNWVLWNWF